MKIPKINKNILLVIALIIVLVVGYFTFFKKSTTSNELVSVEVNAISPEVQTFMVELNRLKALNTINKDIFTDPVFVSLKDFTVEVLPQPFGRNNPFAPIGNEQ